MIRMLMAVALATTGAGSVHAETASRIVAPPARDGWFVCDAVEGLLVAFVGVPDAQRQSLVTLLDRRTGRMDTQAYTVGRADPGAGNIFWSLSRSGREVGSIHGINPRMVDGSQRLAPMRQVTIAGTTLDCRWVADMAFLGADARRSVMVTKGVDGLVYDSFDFAKRGARVEKAGAQSSNVPTLRIVGGRATADGYRFANGGYSYVIARNGAGPATLTVSKGGAVVQTERLVGYEQSTGAQAAARLGPDAVWNGEGLDGCRRNETQAALRQCVSDRMRAAGVSAAGIAFAARGGVDLGYVSGWRQAGPVGIAAVTYPFRANTNAGTALIPSEGDPILVDAYALTPADKARAD
jgi:hypothetical protein